MARFKAREIRNDASQDEIRRQLNEIQKEIASDLAVALSRSRVTELLIDGPYAAGYGDVVRVAPPTGGFRLILPALNLAQPAARVVVVVEAATGALSVEAIDTTVNGATTQTYLSGVGTVEFQLTPTGWYGWSASLLTIPLTSLASQAADTFVGNVTGAAANPVAVGLSTLAGAGLAFAAHTLDVTGSTSITIASDQVQRAALTGDVTAAANGNATTIAANAVTNAKAAQMAARRVKLRADSAGTGDPTDGTGAQAAEILRFATLISDAASTGTIVTYALTEAANVVRFTSGITALTLRGATIPAETGQFIIWENNDDTAVTVTFNNEDASAAAAGNRFRAPGGANYALLTGHRLVTCYINQRHRIIATA